MPEYVSKSGTTINYSWFADGSKYMVTSAGKGYRYTGSLIYASNNGNLQIESTDFAGGRINLVENTSTNALSQDIQYFHTDHLGSVRAITNQGGSVVEQNAYYPFGSRHTFGNTYAQTTNRFKFNGKEEQTTGNLNYLDYGARMYDANIGQWMVQDPLAEQMYMVTPYRFSLNNPVNFIDPDGLFETRREARRYRREYDTGGHVEKNEDGTYSINNKKTGYSYSKQTDADPNTIGLDENGVVKSIIVTPYTHNENPIIQSIYDGHQEFIEHPITKITATVFSSLFAQSITSSLTYQLSSYSPITYKNLVYGLPFKKSRSALQYYKNGGYKSARKDFNRLKLTKVRNIKIKGGVGKVGINQDGINVIVRSTSSSGRATLEFQYKKALRLDTK